MTLDFNDILRMHGKERARDMIESGKTAGRFDRRFLLSPLNAVKLATAPSYLVKGIIPRTGLAVVWGPPKCGKSFWTFDIMAHVALGWDYRGHRVQQGAVVYLALEGAHGFAARIEAWRRKHLNGGHGDGIPFYLLGASIDLIADHGALIKAVRAQLPASPAAVVIDTLDRSLNGSEAKDQDMARYIRAADAIREAFNCAVIVVHHCGYDESHPRGHTALTAAADAQIAVKKDDTGIVTATVQHMKDGKANAVIAFELEQIELAVDDDGEPITSCVVVASEASATAKGPKLSGTAKRAFEQLCELIADTGVPPPGGNHIPAGVRVIFADSWRERFYKAHIGTNRDTKKKAFSRAGEQLQNAHLIGVWEDLVWIAGQPGHAGTNAKMSRGR